MSFINIHYLIAYVDTYVWKNLNYFSYAENILWELSLL